MNHTATRVAILAATEKTQQRLSTLLEDAGLNVVAHELPGERFLQQLENASPDVLLVDLSEENGTETEIIDTLLDYDELPIFFNDSSPAGGGANALWAKKLARKLAELASQHEPVVENFAVDDTQVKSVAAPAQDDKATAPASPGADMAPCLDEAPTIATTAAVEVADTVEPVLKSAPVPADAGGVEKPAGAAVNLWVLGASLGGPQAVRQFLAAVEPDLPVGFVLAQHIGANHISLLAEQLNRVTPFTVLVGRAGHLIRHHEVILTPADKDIRITDDGYLSLKAAQQDAIYSPSIDNVITAVAEHYSNMAGTIVFSGMGDDGARGCEAMARQGGIVWAQDVDSCVISSMPDQARKTNTVTYSANPRALAERLYQYYREE